MNPNIVFNLTGVKPTIIKFNPEGCIFENFRMGLHNNIPEYCVRVIPPNASTAIELFCKEGDIILVLEFWDRNNLLVNYTATSLPFDIANNYLECYDEVKDDYVTLEQVFSLVDEDDIEPTSEDLRNIEDTELEELLFKSQHLTIEDLLSDEDN